MNEAEISRRLINNDSLFRKVKVVTQKYDIVPDDKEHMGTYIEYQDLMELRSDFLDELVDSLVDWIYSSEKFEKIKNEAIKSGKSEQAAAAEVIRRAKNKFRGKSSDEKLLIQGQMGELLLFHYIQRFLKAVPLLRKMPITTSRGQERFGADAIHYKVEGNKNIIVLGEAKAYTSKYTFNAAFADALDSILTEYKKHRDELNLYAHEDFLDEEMNEVAEKYLNNTLENTEIHLVSLVVYNETSNIDSTSEDEIKRQIEEIIKERYANFDNSKIDLAHNPILKRITYIVFPIWKFDELARDFQSKI